MSKSNGQTREGVQNSGGKRGPMPGMQRKADSLANSPAIGDKSQRSDAPWHRIRALSRVLSIFPRVL